MDLLPWQGILWDMDLLLQNVLLSIICLGFVMQEVVVPPFINKEIMIMLFNNLPYSTYAREKFCSEDFNLCRIYPSLSHNFSLLGCSH